MDFPKAAVIGLIGDAETVDEPRRFAPRAQLRVDGPAAAVHDDERAGDGESNDAVRRRAHRRGILEQFTSELQNGRRHSSPSVSSKP